MSLRFPEKENEMLRLGVECHASPVSETCVNTPIFVGTQQSHVERPQAHVQFQHVQIVFTHAVLERTGHFPYH